MSQEQRRVLCVTMNSTMAGPTAEKLLETICRKGGHRRKAKEYVEEGKLSKEDD